MAWEWLGPTATAVVGVAGIVGTATAAALARRAQVDVARLLPLHALINEKRQLYSRFLRAAEDMIDVTLEWKSIQAQVAALEQKLNESPENDQFRAGVEDMLTPLMPRSEAIKHRLEKAAGELRRLRAEIDVIGGPEMGMLANNVIVSLLSEMVRDSDEPIDALRLLAAAMHGDTNLRKEESRELLRELMRTIARESGRRDDEYRHGENK